MRLFRVSSSQHRCRGFSLIELLVAVAIAAAMASLGISSYSNHTARVKAGNAAAELARIELAITTFATQPDRLDRLPGDLAELDLGPDLLTDPWGRAYRYTPLDGAGLDTTARHDGHGRPLNRDYDLYSLGPDGLTGASLAETAAADDILRIANGGFLGSGAEYAAIGGAATGMLTSAGDGPGRSGGLDPRRR